MAACKQLCIIVVFYFYFLTSYQAKIKFLTKQQCSKYLVPTTNSTFGNGEGKNFDFGHSQLYSLLSPTMIQQTFDARSAKITKHRRKMKSKLCRHQISSYLQLLVLMLMLCGDVHPNPGPNGKALGSRKRTPKFPCTVCERGVIATSKAVSCDQCEKWTHIICCGVSVDDYNLCLNSGKQISHVCNICLLREMVTLSLDETLDEQTLNPVDLDNVASDSVYEPFSKKGLHFLHLNARSSLSKLSDVRLLVMNSKASQGSQS